MNTWRAAIEQDSRQALPPRDTRDSYAERVALHGHSSCTVWNCRVFSKPRAGHRTTSEPAPAPAPIVAQADRSAVEVSSSRWSAKICSISSIIIVIRILTLFVLIFFLLFGYLSIWSGGHLHNHINRTRRFVQCDIGCYQAQGDICYAVLAIGVWQQRCQCFRGYHSCEILQLVNSSIQSIRISLYVFPLSITFDDQSLFRWTPCF